MQEDESDLLEVLIFNEIEETVGTWLRAIIQRLEKEQAAIRRDQQQQPNSGYEMLRVTPFYQKHHPKSTKPACPTALDWRGQVLPSSDRSGFGKRE